jgi:alkylation response protein AidB-like acyl-CoA dehydrogenase
MFNSSGNEIHIMYDLTEEQRMIRQAAGDIAEEFADNACTWQGEFPWENLKVLAENGFIGINLSEEYGGGGMSEFENLLVVEEIGRVCPDTGTLVNAMSMVGPRTVEMFGTEAAKEKYLPPVINGETFMALAMSEPEAGSDLRNMNTTVEQVNGEYYLNGEKIWTSHFPESDSVVVWAMFEETMGAVIIDTDSAGIELNNHFTNMAGETQTHWFMEDVHVPKENILISEPGQFKEQLKALNWERLSIPIHSNAQALCAMEKAVEYAQEREQFGQPISEFQGIRWKIADMSKKLEVSRAMTHKTALTADKQNDTPDPLDTHIANLYAGEVVQEIVSESLQLFGATGYMQGHPLEYLYRFVRGRRLGGGTDEIMKNTIGDHVLKNNYPASR